MRNQKSSLRKSPRPSFRSKNGTGKATGSGPEVDQERKERHVIRESGSLLRAIDTKKLRF